LWPHSAQQQEQLVSAGRLLEQLQGERHNIRMFRINMRQQDDGAAADKRMIVFEGLYRSLPCFLGVRHGLQRRQAGSAEIRIGVVRPFEDGRRRCSHCCSRLAQHGERFLADERIVALQFV
jgi:hypothetical protein